MDFSKALEELIRVQLDAGCCRNAAPEVRSQNYPATQLRNLIK